MSWPEKIATVAQIVAVGMLVAGLLMIAWSKLW